MAVTILEALQNAQINLKGKLSIQHEIGMDQLNNAIALLKKGRNLNDFVEPLLEEHVKPCETLPRG